MSKKLPKEETKKKIEEFFADIKSKSPKEVRKIKRLAMRHNIRLKEKRKLFCKKCFNPYKTPKIRIKKGFKRVECENCGYVSRYRIKKDEKD